MIPDAEFRHVPSQRHIRDFKGGCRLSLIALGCCESFKDRIAAHLAEFERK